MASEAKSFTAQAIAAKDTTGVCSNIAIERRAASGKDVQIKVTHCGICHSDLHQLRGEWPIPAFYPMTAGHEVVGVVEAVGPDVTKYSVGDRVGVGCMVGSCRSCPACDDGLEQYCDNGFVGTYNACLSKPEDVRTKNFGASEVTHGGYSSAITVDEHFVCSIPENIELKVAGPLLCAGITTYSPLAHYGCSEGGKTVGIIGFGGLGHMAVKIAKAMGNKVMVFSRSDRKKPAVEKLGATFVKSNAEGMKSAAASCDLLLNTVSAWHDVTYYFSALKVSGTMVLLGLPAKDLKIAPFSVIMRRIKFGGSLIGGMAETQEMLDFCGKHNIVPDIELIPAKDVNHALATLAENSSPANRFVIDIEGTLKPDTVIEADDRINPADWEVGATVHPKSADAHAAMATRAKLVHGIGAGALIAAAAVAIGVFMSRR